MSVLEAVGKRPFHIGITPVDKGSNNLYGSPGKTVRIHEWPDKNIFYLHIRGGDELYRSGDPHAFVFRPGIPVHPAVVEGLRGRLEDLYLNGIFIPEKA